MNLAEAKELTTIYCDAYFTASSFRRRDLAKSRRAAADFDGHVQLNATEWKTVATTDATLRTQISAGFLHETPAEVEARFRQSAEKYERDIATRRFHFSKIDEIVKESTLLAASAGADLEGRVRKFLAGLKPVAISQNRSDDESFVRSILQSANRNTLLPEVIERCEQCFASIDAIRGMLKIAEPTYSPAMTSTGLLGFLRESIQLIETLAHEYKESGSTDSLKDLLQRGNLIVQCVRTLNRDRFAQRLLQTIEVDALLRTFEQIQLSIPLHRAFETGLDLTVLGAAGAGKTTNLQVYAKRAGSRGRLVLFAALPALVRHLNKVGDQLPTLESAMASYLTESGCAVSEPSLIQALETKPAVSLLDSIDEAIGSFPQIIEFIEQFRHRFPKLQIITTSRISGEFVERTPFLQLTLLPFTST